MDARIPSELIAPPIRRYIAGQGDPIMAVAALAERAQVSTSLLERVIAGTHRTVNSTVDFNDADRLLCAANLVHLWRAAPLREVYYTIDLGEPELIGTERVCAAPGCHNVFSPSEPKTVDAVTGRGHSRKVYCSRSCQTRARQIRAGTRGDPSEGRQLKCRHGHPRTPANTEYLRNGTRRCRVCQRARTNEFRARQRAAMAA